MKIKISAIVCVLFFGSSTFQQNPDIELANWIIGTWENKTQRGSIFETWSKIKDNELAAKSYKLNGKDTVVFETVRLIQEQDSLFYIPTVKNQNGGLPVRFSLHAISDGLFVFQNPTHDFPQVIAYKRINADSMVAEVSGVVKGQQRKEMFPMKRIKR
ncbi:MAG TPA: DUF6265 family protein [Ohtaekwangia sp.]|nr:DUF6265 family protein [Ohtaekwangia sp.]